MSVMMSQFTSLTIVYSTVYSGEDQRKHQKLCVTGLREGNSPVTGEFPTQRASNVESVSIWWHHYETWCSQLKLIPCLESPPQSVSTSNMNEMLVPRWFHPILLCQPPLTGAGWHFHWAIQHIWRLWRQKQVSQEGISNYIRQYSVGWNYLSLPEISASGTKVLIYVSAMRYCYKKINILKKFWQNSSTKRVR